MKGLGKIKARVTVAGVYNDAGGQARSLEAGETFFTRAWYVEKLEGMGLVERVRDGSGKVGPGAALAAALAEREEVPPPEEPEVVEKPGPGAASSEALEDVGIFSPKAIYTLARRFPTLADVAKAEDDDLLAIVGIGAKTVEKIRAFLLEAGVT